MHRATRLFILIASEIPMLCRRGTGGLRPVHPPAAQLARRGGCAAVLKPVGLRGRGAGPGPRSAAGGVPSKARRGPAASRPARPMSGPVDQRVSGSGTIATSAVGTAATRASVAFR
jgi:hypothetical protein